MLYNIKEVGKFCKFFRSEVLKLTLDDLSYRTGIKVSTLSSFENGRSRNLEHINIYLRFADDEQEKFFRDNIPYKVGD